MPGLPGLFWTQRQDIGPAPRWGCDIAFDPVRQTIVLFGGSSGVTDTWEWDGNYWKQVSDMGPSARRNHGMAWDDASQQVLLFGGSQGTYQSPTPLGDTWAWDGQNWTQLDDTGPSARHLFGIASDTTGNRIILFGGANPSNGNQQLLGDTWEWDGTVWSQQDETGPSPRMGQSMTYDSVRGRVVLFGGVGETAYLGDTWERNGNNWVRVSHFGPVTRAFAGLGFDGSECILFGGEIETLTSPASVFLGDTWSWDGRLWTQRQDIGPQARCSHAMTFDGSRKKMVLFGGSGRGTQTDLGDTWELAERSNPGG